MEEELIKKLSLDDFIQIMGEEPQSEGLHVFISKNFTQIPITYPFRNLGNDILFVEKGSLKVSINLITHTLKKNESIAVAQKSVIQMLEISDDLSVININFSTKFIVDNFFKSNSIDAFSYFTHNNAPKLKLSKQEGKMFKIMARILKDYNKKEQAIFKEEIIRNTFGVIAYKFAEIFKRTYPDLKVELSRQEELAIRFWNILQENVKIERSVQFYANTLNVTTGHLSKTLKEVSGKTASQLIEAAVIIEARLLLQDPKLSISQITEELNFPDQSFFGKYFKKQMGLSPSAYRKENRK
ncbi:AraC family transcriptional regulator [Maribacter polysiphoniae]|uniref:AraC family transcriptional regulator n=1 Tax=Maribacter polysiphoniae TaxID=429344 RepID=A0A316DTW5_9FLAO|nr:helix-turn-helix domain-containing protein [Maribacter polysiphoniae]MBD1262218.1 AraC family transcriptional regulator [Maribacter polysiphoniae]PWK21521.1 AraC-like DNA-binding protein [Maribacter polysiphoniae]